MDNAVILITQISTILLYVATLFGLYRLLVSQKDATIEALKEQINLLKEQLDAAKAESPSVLAERLSKRVKLFEEELLRLSNDQDRNEELIEEKEQELILARRELDSFGEELEEAREALSEYHCPFCDALLSTKEYHRESVEYKGRELDIEHEIISYECGLTIHDGKEVSPCSNRNPVESAS